MERGGGEGRGKQDPSQEESSRYAILALQEAKARQFTVI